MGSYSRLKTFHALDLPISCTLLDRMNGEIQYVDALGSIPANMVTQWSGKDIVAMDAYIYERSHLKAKFRHIQNTSGFWEPIRNEGSFRSNMGWAIPYQCLTLFGVRDSYKARAFFELTSFWSRGGVPRVCSVEIPAVLTDNMRELMEPESG